MASDALRDELARTVGSRREAEWLLEEVDELDEPERTARARALAERRATGEPLQYVVGHWPFRTLDLLVDGRALIPRPETEVLVGLALERLGARRGRSLACDLGCGAGAIALSLDVESASAGRDVDVVATDADHDALALARHNAAHVGARRVRFAEGDWYDALDPALRGRVDVLCANPPYVAARDAPTLARELCFEPAAALFAGDGSDGTPGLAAVEAVVGGAAPWLSPGGVLLVEHGDAQGARAVALATDVGLRDVVDHRDLTGRPRVLEARRPR